MTALDAAIEAVLDDPETPEHYVTINDEAALRAVLRRHLQPLVAATWADARRVVERQTNLPALVHFDRPSDFSKAILSCLTALDAEAPK